MKEFNKALGNFINDSAAGGAVRHLADLGYSISEIEGELNYPVSKEKIAYFMWAHYLNIGKISLEEPKQVHEKTSFVKEQDEYGRVSFRRVVEEVDNSDKEYVQCEFGKEIYKGTEEFKAFLEKLQPGDREYVQLMPWPLTPVYHELDERMKRIVSEKGQFVHK